MSIPQGPTFDQNSGYGAHPSIVRQGGAMLDLGQTSGEGFSAGTATVGDQAVTIVPASAAGRFVRISNDGYCSVRLGSSTSGVTGAGHGYLLLPNAPPFAAEVSGEIAAVAPAGCTAELSISIGV